MSNRRIATASLAIVCRKLGVMLESGVPIRKAFKLAGEKAADPTCREAMQNVTLAITEGGDVASAMEEQGNAFPPIMRDLVHVGEETGAMPEILRSLSGHFDNLVRLRRNFLTAIAWPMFQLVASILVIGALIWILGWIASTKGGEPAFAILPFGLAGTRGAIVWLVGCFGTLGLIIGGYIVISRSLQGRKVMHRFLLRIPKIGSCMRSFAVARFSWAFALTQQAGMSIRPSLKSSLNATSNGAFMAANAQVWNSVREGEPLADALRKTELFPSDFIEMVQTAEYSGTVPEMLEHLSPQFEEDARRSLRQLAEALGWAIWAMVAVFIIILIFRIALQYVGMINDLT